MNVFLLDNVFYVSGKMKEKKKNVIKGSSEQAVYSQRIWKGWSGNVKQYLSLGNMRLYVCSELTREDLKKVVGRLETFLLQSAYQ